MDKQVTKRKRLLNLASTKDTDRSLFLLAEINDIDDKIDISLNNVRNSLENSLNETKKAIPYVKDGYTPIKGVDYFDGTDYVLTDEDKQAIAQKVKVPVVEKVVQTIVEKTEVIKEQPIVTQQITNEIKEVAITENPEQIVSKVNLSSVLIEPTQVKGLADIERIAKENRSVPVTTSFFNGLRAKNLNIVGATASQAGDTVNLVVSSGSASPLTTKGDVWGFSTVDARIAVGGNGTVLTADSTQALGVKWATPFSSPLTTKGDLLGFSTLNARLPVGSNGFVLTADSTQTLGVKWETITSSQWVGTASTTVYYGPAFGRSALFSATDGSAIIGDMDSVGGGVYLSLGMGGLPSAVLELNSGTFLVQDGLDGCFFSLAGTVTLQAGDTETLSISTGQGGVMNLLGGKGDSPGSIDGSPINIISGAGGTTDGAHNSTNGGSITLKASDGGDGDISNGSGNGGDVFISAGKSGTDNGGGNGLNGNIFMATIGGWVSVGGLSTPTAVLTVTGSNSARSGLRLRSGSDPSSPQDGDLWYNGTHLVFRKGGTSINIV